MHKIMGLIAAVAMVGTAGIASAADAPQTDASKELTTVEMDAVSAGVGVDGTNQTPTAGVRKIGNSTFVFNGISWTRVR